LSTSAYSSGCLIATVSATNLEPVFSFWQAVTDLDILDSRGAAPFVTELDHLFDGVLWSLEDRLDATVSEVADPSIHAVLAGLPSRRRPESHSLYFA
jgi:hypothetical protein